MTEGSTAQPNYAETAAEIVAAYVSNNHVALTDMPALIRSVHDALTGLDKSAAAEAPAELLRPAVPVRKSVTDEYIFSLEDGRKFKSMKRYLTGLGMTAADYRAKWGLPSDYPMVAPAYARQRSALARTLGLGRRPAETSPQPNPTPQPEPEVAGPAPKRGRAKKAA